MYVFVQRINTSALYEISMQTHYLCLGDMKNHVNYSSFREIVDYVDQEVKI
jgi:hypothetical protein